RGVVTSVLVGALERQRHARAHADEAVGPEADRLALEPLLAALLDVFLRDAPRRTGRRRRIEREKVGPGRVEHEAHAMRIDNLYSLHPLVQHLGRCAAIAVEAELHVLGRERIAVVELEAL